MTVRPVDVPDLDLLSEFWYDGMALRSQKQASIRLMPDAIDQWQIYAHSLFYDDEALFSLVEIDGDILGCIVGRVVDNQPGLLPLQYGIVEQLVLDLHSPHKRKNAVNELLEVLKTHFRQKDISHIMVAVPAYSPIEQGFWRGLGLTHLEDTFWMDL